MPNLMFLAPTVPEIWIGGGHKISKVGHVTPSRPVNGGSPMTRYLNSSTPICLFTIQLSLGYDDD